MQEISCESTLSEHARCFPAIRSYKSRHNHKSVFDIRISDYNS